MTWQAMSWLWVEHELREGQRVAADAYRTPGSAHATEDRISCLIEAGCDI